jgi:hypothetical protein
MNRNELYSAMRKAVSDGDRDAAGVLYRRQKARALADVRAARDAGWTDIDVCGISEPETVTGCTPEGKRAKVPMLDDGETS